MKKSVMAVLALSCFAIVIAVFAGLFLNGSDRAPASAEQQKSPIQFDGKIRPAVSNYAID